MTEDKLIGANERLGLPRQDGMAKVAICFDVDGTLITEGSDRDRFVSLLKLCSGAFKNAKIVVWSGGGNRYAEQIARDLEITDCVWKFMSKHQHKELRALGYQILVIDDIQDTAIGDINLIARQDV